MKLGEVISPARDQRNTPKSSLIRQIADNAGFMEAFTTKAPLVSLRAPEVHVILSIGVWHPGNDDRSVLTDSKKVEGVHVRSRFKERALRKGLKQLQELDSVRELFSNAK